MQLPLSRFGFRGSPTSLRRASIGTIGGVDLRATKPQRAPSPRLGASARTSPGGEVASPRGELSILILKLLLTALYCRPMINVIFNDC